MDQTSRAAFVIAQAACLQAVVAAMQWENHMDQLAGRPITHQPQDFYRQIDIHSMGHNTVISYLSGS